MDTVVMTPDEQRQLLIQYLLLKVEQADWHAVADAAMDLRELEAAQAARREGVKARCVPERKS